MSKEIFYKEYDDETLYDINRDITEAFDARFNPIMETIPHYDPPDDCFMRGTFKVTIKWNDENED